MCLTLERPQGVGRLGGVGVRSDDILLAMGDKAVRLYTLKIQKIKLIRK